MPMHQILSYDKYFNFSQLVCIGHAATASICCIIVSSCLSREASSQPTNPLPQVVGPGEIFKAWHRHQSRIATARFRWKEETLYPRGSLTGYYQPGSSTAAEGREIPASDTKLSIEYSVNIDANNFHLDKVGEAWSFTEDKPVSEHHSAGVYGTESARVLDLKGVMPYNIAGIANPLEGKMSLDTNNIHLFPILSYYRPFHTTIGHFNLAGKNAVVGKERVIVRGRECITLRIQSDSVRTDHEAWTLDPARNFLILRYEHRSMNAIKAAMDVDYQPDLFDKSEWVPKRWTIVVTGQKAEWSHISESTLVHHKINPALSRSDFEVPFPPETRVVDAISRTNYVIKSDGEKRMMTDAEDDYAPFDELLATKTGEAKLNLPKTARNRTNIARSLSILLVTATPPLVFILYKLFKIKPREQS